MTVYSTVPVELDASSRGWSSLGADGAGHDPGPRVSPSGSMVRRCAVDGLALGGRIAAVEQAVGAIAPTRRALPIRLDWPQPLRSQLSAGRARSQRRLARSSPAKTFITCLHPVAPKAPKKEQVGALAFSTSFPEEEGVTDYANSALPFRYLRKVLSLIPPADEVSGGVRQVVRLARGVSDAGGAPARVAGM